jgi:hypothetical protein
MRCDCASAGCVHAALMVVEEQVLCHVAPQCWGVEARTATRVGVVKI